MQINHGIPDTDFFMIALPADGEPIGRKINKGTKDDPYKVIELKDPNIGGTNRAEIHDVWRLKAGEDGLLVNAWAKLAYGITGPKLVNIMTKRYPGFNENLIIDFLLLKKL